MVGLFTYIALFSLLYLSIEKLNLEKIDDDEDSQAYHLDDEDDKSDYSGDGGDVNESTNNDGGLGNYEAAVAEGTLA